MATERVIDLENRRYADREYEGRMPLSVMDAELARAERQRAAAERLRKRVRAKPDPRGVFLSLSDLTDLLIVLGLDDW